VYQAAAVQKGSGNVNFVQPVKNRRPQIRQTAAPPRAFLRSEKRQWKDRHRPVSAGRASRPTEASSEAVRASKSRASAAPRSSRAQVQWARVSLQKLPIVAFNGYKYLSGKTLIFKHLLFLAKIWYGADSPNDGSPKRRLG
jgi:hypothetical protein